MYTRGIWYKHVLSKLRLVDKTDHERTYPKKGKYRFVIIFVNMLSTIFSDKYGFAKSGQHVCFQELKELIFAFTTKY